MSDSPSDTSQRGARYYGAVPGASVQALRDSARGCRACPLWQLGTQTVFGDGPRGAALMLVGEQPGDEEDRSGRPFVGPAGRLLDAALEQAAIERASIYVTNAVKHFKWEPRGRRRIHKTPAQREFDACQPWLAAEIAAIGPRLIVCLGASAARAVFDRVVRIGAERGRVLDSPFGVAAIVTAHPAAVLRAPPSLRTAAYADLVADLAGARDVLEAVSG